MGTVETYFVDEDGAGLKVNSKRYFTMRRNILRPNLADLGITTGTMNTYCKFKRPDSEGKLMLKSFV